MPTVQITETRDGAQRLNGELPPDGYDVLLGIATAAMQKAQERGHVLGYERQDWLDAEREVLAQVYGLTGSAC